MKIFIISDTHFNHKKLLEYENRPENFNDIIIKNWNKLVTDEDLVIHLGDVILGKDADLPIFLAQLNGKKILCRGNHDHNPDTWYMTRGFDFVCDYYVYRNLAFSHAPLTPLPFQTVKQKSDDKSFTQRTVDINVHGHFHRGKHRGKVGMPDRYYDHEYFDLHRDNYRLVQIEDKLSPFSLDEVLREECACMLAGLRNNLMTKHSKYNCSNSELGIMKA